MTFQTWWLYAFAVFLLSGTPGPNMLHVMTRSVEFGFRRSMAAMAGCMLAITLVLAASAAGLTALLKAIPGAFEVLRYFGVAYLVYLGIKSWRAKVSAETVVDEGLTRRSSPAALFRGGFTIAISNPKLLLFAAAFFPQFINPAEPKAPQFALLVGTFAVIEMLWYCTYALAGGSLSTHLRKPSVKRLFNRVTGSIFVGFGAALLTSRTA
ncbi:threonine/homoserine/homoserine lactone efflux protein [Novosphingobium sp. PhB57]|jgi:threonine/homoserine/homoserine lactone efflux protein|uniref:LysE family translocator n=1 Tax=unclassified Novosphingobium TaxID=2644732 RepID=UPI00105013F0|nr:MULTISPECIES: LysE family translocator [unclassified Novosphingobium]TCU54451.1 threonine/homoserine/homoserine lactone efflux protein [Novosphingobium sp. PhB57]TDW59571.1 threonine/homoserine/homoserine lactone efflux protein [Novosphingobium sp. PhB55]